MHICEIDSLINSNKEYFIKFTYKNTKNYDVNNIHNIVNYIRLKYELNRSKYVVEYDNIEFELLKTDKNTKEVFYKLLLTKINSKLKTLPTNMDCHLIICLKDEIENPSLFIQK
jgi:hypothetical protein